MDKVMMLYTKDPVFVGVYFDTTKDMFIHFTLENGLIHMRRAFSRYWYWAAMYKIINFMIEQHKASPDENTVLMDMIEHIYGVYQQDTDGYTKQDILCAMTENEGFLKRRLLSILSCVTWQVKEVPRTEMEQDIPVITNLDEGYLIEYLRQQGHKEELVFEASIINSNQDFIDSYPKITVIDYPYVLEMLKRTGLDQFSCYDANGTWETIMYKVSKLFYDNWENKEYTERFEELYNDAIETDALDKETYQQLQEQPLNYEAFENLLIDCGYLEISNAHMNDDVTRDAEQLPPYDIDVIYLDNEIELY